MIMLYELAERRWDELSPLPDDGAASDEFWMRVDVNYIQHNERSGKQQFLVRNRWPKARLSFDCAGIR